MLLGPGNEEKRTDLSLQGLGLCLVAGGLPLGCNALLLSCCQLAGQSLLLRCHLLCLECQLALCRHLLLL